MGKEIAAITQCRLCSQRFAGPPALIVGHENGRVENLLARLIRHMIEAHPREDAALQLSAAEFLGMRRLMNFRTADDQISQQIDELRWRIHRETSLHSIPDEKINTQTLSLAMELVGDVHDWLE